MNSVSGRFVELQRVRRWCDELAGKSLNKSTFSRWCGWLSIEGNAGDAVAPETAAALVSFALLHRMEVRNYQGYAYRMVYPHMHHRVIQLMSYEPDPESAAGCTSPGAQVA
jgi:hypothetical protein